jgi:hypothetical protein
VPLQVGGHGDGVTMGYYGMGTPIGSPHFVEEYYNEQLTTVQSAMHSLTNSIIDLLGFSYKETQ